MANGDFDDTFARYYTMYRMEAQTPNSSDDEYTIALNLSKESVDRWANYDGTYWKELFTTAQANSTGAVLTIAANTTTYATPSAMREAGGYIWVINATGNIVRRYPIINPQEAQFRGDNSQYCYFTGSPNQGYTLNLNPVPDTSVVGLQLNYVYYKKPSYYTTGASFVEMANPSFIVHHMLQNRFRGSRNPYYGSAKQDAEDCLRMMQADNNSGTWANPSTIADNSGTVWGAPVGSGWRF